MAEGVSTIISCWIEIGWSGLDQGDRGVSAASDVVAPSLENPRVCRSWCILRYGTLFDEPRVGEDKEGTRQLTEVKNESEDGLEMTNSSRWWVADLLCTSMVFSDQTKTRRWRRDGKAKKTQRHCGLIEGGGFTIRFKERRRRCKGYLWGPWRACGPRPERK
jgi:hypothetical protein